MTGDVGSMLTFFESVLTSCEPVLSKEDKPLFEASSKKAFFYHHNLPTLCLR